MFERRDIWDLSEEDPWHPIIEWYARAVGAMQGRDGADFSDPTSWRYLANIHGVDLEELPRRSWPRGATWRECQHSSWFFLPWHRIYLHYFEQVVRQTIVDLGGPDDWALPYWDYSDPERENVRRLPPAFREQQMPSGDPNPLFVSQRRTTPFNINEGDKIPPRFEFVFDPTPAFTTPFFSTRDMDPDPVTEVLARGFGGPRTGWNWFGGTPGLLEDLPHNWVHGLVGGWRRGDVGWMSDPTTAARDPIFWLHHANIDRLWEAWVAFGDPDDPDNRDFRNPSATRWRNMWFKVGGGASAVTLSVREVLDTTRPPLNYRYSNISVPSVPASAPAAVLAANPDTEESIPEMVGASESRTPLAAEPTEVEIAVGGPSGPAFRGRAEGAQPRKVYLQVKNVRGKEPVAVGYLVYVDLPPGADPTTDPTTYEDRRVGQIAMFGVRGASEPDGEHSGSGLTFSFDITDVYMRLRDAGEWDAERLRVTFAPALPGAEQGGDVSAGQVSLFYA